MKKAILGVVAASAMLSGCATQSFVINEGAASPIATSSEMDIFFVAGIGQEQTTQAAQICGGAENIQRVESTLGPVDIIISSLSSGIVTPRTAEVYCLAQ